VRPNVNIEATIEKVEARGSSAVMRAEVTLTNTGATEISFFDALFTVNGLDVSQVPMREPEFGVEDPSLTAANDTANGYQDLLLVERLVRPGGHLVPDQSLTTSSVFEVASRRASVLRVVVHLSAVVDEGRETRKATICRPPLDPEKLLCHEALIEVNGTLRNELFDVPVARTNLGAPGGEIPSLNVFFYRNDAFGAEAERSGDHLEADELFPLVNSRGFTSAFDFYVSSS